MAPSLISHTIERPRLVAVAAMPVLPASNGYALRVSNLLRELAARWRVTLVAPLGAGTAEDLEELGVERVVPIDLFGPWGAPVGAADRRAIHALMDRVIADDSPEAAIVWACAEEVVFETPDFPPTVLDRLDCEVLGAWRELRHARDGRNRLRALRDMSVWALRERRMVRAVACTLVDGETDARLLRMMSGREQVHVVTNGVMIQPRATPDEEATVPTIVFTGNLSYQPNVRAVRWFVEFVLPAVRAVVPATRFVVAGRNPAPEILGLGTVPGVEIAGEVRDLASVLRAAWLAVAPLQTGSGVRTKMLEAWAVGRPVVLSPVAASGVHLDDDAASLVTRNAPQTARVIQRLLQDDRERHRLGASAHALAAREYGGWSRPGARVSELLHAAIAASGPGRSRRLA